LLAALFVVPAVGAEQEDMATGEKLAALLRAGRTVVSSNQALINDPAVGDKKFDGAKLAQDAEEIYAGQTGDAPLAGAVSERDRRLLAAQLEAMRATVDDHQDDINAAGVGFKGFIPAVFARITNEKFAAAVGEEARVRVTAPLDLVRNRKAKPDKWERNVLETKFSAPDWPKGEAYTEMAEVDGRPAFRMLLPEYYRESCLSCHGEPKGQTDITGYPMEGGKVGALAGAISITLFK
jgi:hypothetical protein